MWIALLLLVGGAAWAGDRPVPLVLPTGEDARAWATAAELAGLRVGPRGDGAWVAVTRDGDRWALEVRDEAGVHHTAPLRPPRDDAGREDAVWLAVSLLEPLGGARVEPGPLSPPVAAAPAGGASVPVPEAASSPAQAARGVSPGGGREAGFPLPVAGGRTASQGGASAAVPAGSRVSDAAKPPAPVTPATRGPATATNPSPTVPRAATSTARPPATASASAAPPTPAPTAPPTPAPTAPPTPAATASATAPPAAAPTAAPTAPITPPTAAPTTPARPPNNAPVASVGPLPAAPVSPEPGAARPIQAAPAAPSPAVPAAPMAPAAAAPVAPSAAAPAAPAAASAPVSPALASTPAVASTSPGSDAAATRTRAASPPSPQPPPEPSVRAAPPAARATADPAPRLPPADLPWAALAGGVGMRADTTTVGAFVGGVGLARGPVRVGMFVGGTTAAHFPGLGDTERMTALDLAVGARWRPAPTFAPLVGLASGISVRRYVAAEDDLVGTALTPFLAGEAGVSWSASPWLEVAPLARATVDLGATALEKGETTLRQGTLGVGLALELTVHAPTIP